MKQSIFPPKSPHANDSCFKDDLQCRYEHSTFQVELGEILINGQQWIHNTTPHKDCECDNGISFCYYVNKEWHPEWGGQLMYKLDDEWSGIDPARKNNIIQGKHRTSW